MRLHAPRPRIRMWGVQRGLCSGGRGEARASLLTTMQAAGLQGAALQGPESEGVCSQGEGGDRWKRQGKDTEGGTGVTEADPEQPALASEPGPLAESMATARCPLHGTAREVGGAHLITLTRSWKALSTLRGGSLALVSMYGIWKAKLNLVKATLRCPKPCPP